MSRPLLFFYTPLSSVTENFRTFSNFILTILISLEAIHVYYVQYKLVLKNAVIRIVMGHWHILQKNGPLTTGIAILNLERMDHWNFSVINFLFFSMLLIKMENGPYYGLSIHITEDVNNSGHFEKKNQQISWHVMSTGILPLRDKLSPPFPHNKSSPLSAS